MFKNYFYLLRSTYELNTLVKDKTIHDIFSQEKNVLFFDISNNDFPHQHLIISANQNLPYIFIKGNHHKAKKNLAELYQQFLPAKIISVTIATDDRIIKINTNKFNLYFLVRGNNTNIILEDNFGNYFPFTKTKLNFDEILKEKVFVNNLDYKIENINFHNITELKNKYPQISSEMRNEIIFRIENNLANTYLESFKDVITEILKNNICVKYIPDIQKTKFFPLTFNIYKTLNCEKSFENFNKAFSEYIRTFYKNKKKDTLSNELKKYFGTNLNKLSNKLNNLKARVEKGSRENEYRHFANLLQANRYHIQKGLNEIELQDYENNEKIKIKLDPKLSVNQNIDRYFEKSRDEKINYNKSKDLFNFTKQKYEELTIIKKQFESATNIADIEEIHKKILGKKNKNIQMETGHKFKYWHYLIDDKYNVFVGRDSKSNDYLSLKFSKQNDYWFHARGLPGSHVILRVENKKEGIPKDVIKKAASIAAFYSKAKTAGTAPVSYTFAKFVHKKKGMLPGKVLLSKENTLLVKPGIPKNCILVEE
jgi:predicted ribosome quality control (RQC) complex YloA/Tae2 family protein